jgi:hypothetical protein
MAACGTRPRQLRPRPPVRFVEDHGAFYIFLDAEAGGGQEPREFDRSQLGQPRRLPVVTEPGGVIVVYNCWSGRLVRVLWRSGVGSRS